MQRGGDWNFLAVGENMFGRRRSQSRVDHSTSNDGERRYGLSRGRSERQACETDDFWFPGDSSTADELSAGLSRRPSQEYVTDGHHGSVPTTSTNLVDGSSDSSFVPFPPARGDVGFDQIDWHDSENPQYVSDSEPDDRGHTPNGIVYDPADLSRIAAGPRTTCTGSSPENSGVPLGKEPDSQLSVSLDINSNVQEKTFLVLPASFRNTSPVDLSPTDSADHDSLYGDFSGADSGVEQEIKESVVTKVVLQSGQGDIGQGAHTDSEAKHPNSELLKRIEDYERKLDASAKAYAELKVERDELWAELDRVKAELANTRECVAKHEITYGEVYTHLSEARRRNKENETKIKQLSIANEDLCKSNEVLQLKVHQYEKAVRSLTRLAEKAQIHRAVPGQLAEYKPDRQPSLKMARFTKRSEVDQLPDLPLRVTGPVRCTVHDEHLYVAFSTSAEETYENLAMYTHVFQLSPNGRSWLPMMMIPSTTNTYPTGLLSNRNGLFLTLLNKDDGDCVIHITRDRKHSWLRRLIGNAENYNCAVASCGNTLIFAGGMSLRTDCSVGAVAALNVLSGQWDKTWPELQYPREGGQLVCIDGCLLIIGGAITVGSTMTPLVVVEELSPLEMTGWKIITHTPHYSAAAACTDKQVYVVCCFDCAEGKQVSLLYGTERASPDWSKCALLKIPRSGTSMCVFKSQLVCVGGWSQGQFTRSVEALPISKQII